jgi:hypothetical protein
MGTIGAIVILVLAYTVTMLGTHDLPLDYGSWFAFVAFVLPLIGLAVGAAAFESDRKR